MRYITSPVKGQPDRRKVFDNKNRRHIKDSHGNMVFTKTHAMALVNLLNNVPSLFSQPIGAYPLSKPFAFSQSEAK